MKERDTWMHTTPDFPMAITYLEVLTETNKAWLLLLKPGVREWFPIGICSLNENAHTIIMPSYMYEDKDLHSKLFDSERDINRNHNGIPYKRFAKNEE